MPLTVSFIVRTTGNCLRDGRWNSGLEQSRYSRLRLPQVERLLRRLAFVSPPAGQDACPTSPSLPSASIKIRPY